MPGEGLYKLMKKKKVNTQMQTAREFEEEFMKPFKAGKVGKTSAGIMQKAHAKMSRTQMNAQRESMGLKSLPSLNKVFRNYR